MTTDLWHLAKPKKLFENLNFCAAISCTLHFVQISTKFQNINSSYKRLRFTFLKWGRTPRRKRMRAKTNRFQKSVTWPLSKRHPFSPACPFSQLAAEELRLDSGRSHKEKLYENGSNWEHSQHFCYILAFLSKIGQFLKGWITNFEFDSIFFWKKWSSRKINDK